MTIVGQRSKNGTTYRQYGCTTHYTRGETVCKNNVTISETKASEHLIAKVREVLDHPDAVKFLSEQNQLQEARRQKSEAHDALTQALTAAERRFRNLLDAVGKIGLSDALSSAIKAAQEDVAALKAKAAKELPQARVIAHPNKIKAALKEWRDTLDKRPEEIREEKLVKHVGTLLMTPKNGAYEFEGFVWVPLGEEEPGGPFPGTPAEGHSTGVSGKSGCGGRI